MNAARETPPPAVFVRYWAAAAISSFGTAVTTVAMPVLVVQLLGASAFEVGMVNAAQFIPYALLGVIAGVYTDRWRRRPILVWASVGRALSLGAIPVLWLCGILEVWMLVAALLLFGSFSVFGFAAAQSLLPRLVARGDLLRANVRLDQTDAAAQTMGPSIGGGLVGLLGAPIALIVDAVSYLVDAALNATLRVDEERQGERPRGVGAEIREGLAWTYRHPTLGPLTLSTHVWFIANGAAMTVLSLLALRELGFSPFTFGLLLTVFGVASLIGASCAAVITTRVGAGRAIIGARAMYPVAWLLVAVAPAAPGGTVALFVALMLQGLAMGTENSPEQMLWQTLTPDRLLGRTNATRRAGNRTLAACGALVAGGAAGLVGERPALVGIAVIFAVAAAIAAFSPLRVSENRSPGPEEERRPPG
ncbi:MFS transporter [Microbacterium sp. VKM Ac-2870]|uniref:MFS transporter n=1 Tax=Microbacterium sp. VKM Ac-2870 TaxID=2783825 RepID=UPI00188A769D|nr:MFS transporter [Microbacterium sp. VKM Ac-2870]MBF4560639.1 MFS transporter [Microbacterium sp. VKM Ac-2870]